MRQGAPETQDGAEVAVGFAASTDDALAYAELRCGSKRELVKVPLRCHPRAALRERDVAYAAVEAVARKLLERGIRRVRIVVEDEELVCDLEARRKLSQALAIPYVRLRCCLNRFASAEVVDSPGDLRCRDLRARARAEMTFNIAA